MEEGYTEFIPFAGASCGQWYRCRRCGCTERYIPPVCPVCKNLTSKGGNDRDDRRETHE